MNTANKLLFENLDERYARTFDTLKTWRYRKLEMYEDVLGFDTDSYGWVAVHKKHSISGLFDELATCRILKKKGYAVELIEESSKLASVDALINGELYEMKRVSSATNLPRAIEKQIRLAYKKADNVVLHIDQPIEKGVLVAALRKAVYNHKGIKNILLMWDDNIKLLSEKDILDSQW
jgi:Contact-dependent growth inhibition CdiA C-terminal domain